MASLRKLRRRLLRWQRYSTATGIHWIFGASHRKRAAGHFRAVEAVAKEQYRRELVAERQLEGACCTLKPSHDGPCVWFCSWCSGDGGCPGCGGFDDLGCDECGGSLACQYCNGAGEFVEDVPVPHVVTECGLTEAGLL
jgi:hypothetical protein